MSGFYRIGLFLIFGVVVATPARGADDAGMGRDSPWERFSLSLGGFIANFNSDVTLGGKELGAGINVDVEDALGLDTSLTVFRGDALFRLGSSRRHRIDLNYYDLRRSSTKNMQAQIEIGDKVFPIGTTVDSFFNIKVIRGGYSYSLIQDERFDFGLGLGLFIMPIEVGVKAVGIGATEESITAPLPTVVLRFDFAITPKWFLRQSIEAFYLEAGDFRGALYSASISVEYKPWKNFGIGAGYNSFDLRIKADGNDYPNIKLTGKIEFSYSGLLLYGKVFF